MKEYEGPAPGHDRTSIEGEWVFEHGKIAKSRRSDGSEGDTAPLAVVRWYDFPEFEGCLGNLGQT